MSEETQEQSVLTTQQQQRTHAAMTAARVLRPSPAKVSLIGSGETPLSYVDYREIIELADYIATGYTYSDKVIREERENNPLFMLLGAIAREPDEEPGEPTTGPIKGDVGVRVVFDLLTLVEGEIPNRAVPPLAVISGWTGEQRVAVADWAGAVHLRASDNDVEIPTPPSVLHDPDCEDDLNHRGECDPII
jgi:hypothetical protein